VTAGAGTPSLQTVDRIIVHGDLLTMDPARPRLHDGGVAVRDGCIVAVEDSGTLLARYHAEELLDAQGGWILPGSINAHQHLTGDPLMRSLIPDGIDARAAIFDWAVPIHGAHGADDDEAAATLAALEMLKSGTTTVIEAGTVAHPRRVAAALHKIGMRGRVGGWGWDVPGVPYSGTASEVLARQADTLDELGGHSERVQGWVTLVGHDLASDDLLQGAAELARSRGVGMTMHLSPTRDDVQAYQQRSGLRPARHLARLGVLGPHLLLAHAVWIDDAEIEDLLASRTAIAYCPWAYLRLAQGVSRGGRHAAFMKAGGRLALGCDAQNASDLPDLHRAAALAVGLARDMAEDPMALTAADGLALMTCAGAQAVGLGEQIGMLTTGMRADLVVHDPAAISCWLDADPALQLVWGTDGRSVQHVMVDGQWVIRDRLSTRVDETALRASLREAQRSLRHRIGR